MPGFLTVRPRKSKDAELYECEQCHATVQIKYKVWLRSNTKANVSAVVRPQCDRCKRPMRQVA